MSHYFETPATPGATFDISVRLWDHDVTLASSKGVFSGTRLDLGTAMLLRTFPPPAGPVRLLDLGCGYGPITAALGIGSPQASITAVDVNRQALALTRANAQRLGFADRVTVAEPDDVDPEVRFDQIWSNPPIRIGKAALHDLLSTWLQRLSPGGVARLVVARNLGADSLTRWLEDQGWPTDRVASAKGYRVLEVAPGVS